MAGSRSTVNAGGFFFKMDSKESILLRKHAETLGYSNVSEFIRQRTIYDFMNEDLDYKQEPSEKTRVQISLDAEHLSKLRTMAQSQGCSVSEFVRRFIIDGEKLRTIVVNREVVSQVLFEIHKQGVNLNQIAKAMNMHGVDSTLVDRAIELNEGTITAVDDILNHLVDGGASS